MPTRRSLGKLPKRAEPQSAVKECVWIPPPVRCAPALGQNGPQPPENPAGQPSPHAPQIADPKVPSPARNHRVELGHDLIHPHRPSAPRMVPDLLLDPLHRPCPRLEMEPLGIPPKTEPEKLKTFRDMDDPRLLWV